LSDSSPLSRVIDTLFAMVVTFVAKNGSRNIVHDWPTIPKDPKSGHRFVTFEGNQYFLAKRAKGDLFIMPGLNMYFGDTIAIPKKVLPQIWRLPVMMHVSSRYDGEAGAAEKETLRFAELVQNAWENLGGTFQVYDFSDVTNPPVPVVSRFVTWARSFRGTWTELGNPTKDVFTNRQWTLEVRYVR
jgi:hypothetical protein